MGQRRCLLFRLALLKRVVEIPCKAFPALNRVATPFAQLSIFFGCFFLRLSELLQCFVASSFGFKGEAEYKVGEPIGARFQVIGHLCLLEGFLAVGRNQLRAGAVEQS